MGFQTPNTSSWILITFLKWSWRNTSICAILKPTIRNSRQSTIIANISFLDTNDSQPVLLVKIFFMMFNYYHLLSFCCWISTSVTSQHFVYDSQSPSPANIVFMTVNYYHQPMFCLQLWFWLNPKEPLSPITPWLIQGLWICAQVSDSHCSQFDVVGLYILAHHHHKTAVVFLRIDLHLHYYYPPLHHSVSSGTRALDHRHHGGLDGAAPQH